MIDVDEPGLRRALNDAAATTAVPPEQWAGPAAPAERGRAFARQVDDRIAVHERRAARRRRTVVGALAAFVVVAGVVAVVVRGSGGDDDGVSLPSSPRTGEPGWASMAPDPGAIRYGYEALWTGDELIVFGGVDGIGPLADAAAYDPEAGTWRHLAPPPTDLSSSLSVWTGAEVLAVAADGSLHAYDPETDRWEERAHSPWRGFGVVSDAFAAAVWAGTELVVVRSRAINGQPSGPIAAYDPATDGWRSLSDPPVTIENGEVFWTGDASGQVLAIGNDAYPSDPDPTRQSVYALDPATAAWTRLPDPPLPEFAHREATFMSWTGTELVIGGGGIVGTDYRDAAAYDPATGTWRSLGEGPVDVIGMDRYPEAWTGSEVIAWQYRADEFPHPTGQPVLVDPATGTWRLGEPSPAGGRDGAPVVWTGHELLWWAGEPSATDPAPNMCCYPDDTGNSYTPTPRPPSP